MKNIKIIFCFFMITMTLSMGLVPSQVEALPVNEVEPLWTTDLNPNPISDHTRCAAVFARGQNWLYFDWVNDQSNPDIYLWNGVEPVPVVATDDREFGPRVLYYDDQFYLTYRKSTPGYLEGEAYGVFLRVSEDGITFGPETELFSPASHVIESHDILFANGWFYLAYVDVAYGDIFMIKSIDLVDWTTPIVIAGTSDTPDFCPALCWARGRIWLAWDYADPTGISTLWIKNSQDGVTWSEPVEIPLDETYNEIWGPFALTWSKGQFVFTSRARHFGTYSTWRICYTTSRDGVTWTDFTLATSESCDPPFYQCVEKGSVVYPLFGDSDNKGFSFAIVFKRLQLYSSGSGETLFFGGIYQTIINL